MPLATTLRGVGSPYFCDRRGPESQAQGIPSFTSALARAVRAPWILLVATLLGGCRCSAPFPKGEAAHYDLEGCNVALEGYDPVAYLTQE
jgi:hypothetical protein